jgi:hypothetical protein
VAAKGTNVQLGSSELGFIERRGARSHRGGSAFSRSAVLSRALIMLNALLEDADPKPRLPPAVKEVAIGALTTPWTLKPLEVRHLEDVLAAAGAELDRLLQGASLERGVVLETVAGLSFAEKCALVDLAIQAHAPGAAMAAVQPG